jgi:glycosyltransferase involved in cell wall biosynthesis
VLADKLADRFDLHVLTWAGRAAGDRGPKWGYYLNPLTHLRAAADRPAKPGRLPVHTAGVCLPVAEGVLGRYPPDWALAPTQWLFRRSVRRLHRRLRFDAVVTAPSHRLTGYPPPLPGAGVVFDYLDLLPDAVEAGYVRAADRIVTVSHTLADRVRGRHGRPATVVPNGVHPDRIRRADPGRARLRWGLGDRPVVSLIGLTCSRRLYFVDALVRVRAAVPGLVFVGVGDGPVLAPLADKCRAAGLPHVLTGWVDPEEVADLFAASDVGLYPGDDTPYYGGASPIKVLEYLAARVPVVANLAAELVRLKLSGVTTCPATADAFAEGIRQALTRRPPEFPDMTEYAWDALAARFGDEIDRAISERRP